MQVKYLATVSLPDEGWDVNMLEEICLEEARKAARELFLRALRHQEEKLLSDRKGKEG